MGAGHHRLWVSIARGMEITPANSLQSAAECCRFEGFAEYPKIPPVLHFQSRSQLGVGWKLNPVMPTSLDCAGRYMVGWRQGMEIK